MAILSDLFLGAWSPLPWPVLIITVGILVSSLVRHLSSQRAKPWPIEKLYTKASGSQGMRSDVDPSSIISPVENLNLDKVAPIPYLPYKFQGHVTMGIQKRERQDWIRMDRGYISRIKDREQLIAEHPKEIFGTGPLVNGAIKELYEEVMIDYLPKRYPTMFQRQRNNCLNLVTKASYPMSSADLSPEEMLRLLGTNVEEDFYFMCPDENDGEYRLQGYIACFPGGFLSPARVGESVREIHKPVPGYDKKLGLSVDRYFARMQPCQFIGRMNWSLQVDGNDLFRVDGNNFYPGMDAESLEEKYDPRIEECFLRVEHQTLCKLPKSGVVIFCVRSYMTPLRELRERGETKELADAIESMPHNLGVYKMRHLWGDKILPWLRA